MGSDSLLENFLIINLIISGFYLHNVQTAFLPIPFLSQLWLPKVATFNFLK